MTQMVPQPAEYFLEVPLYHSFALTSQESFAGLVRIEFFVGTLDTFCVGCKQHSVFQSRATLPRLASLSSSQQARSADQLLKERQAVFSNIVGQPVLDVLDYVVRPKHFQSRFVCSRDAAHQLFFETKVLGTTFEKVGQYPSLADLHLGDLQKYRKVLGEQYAELARGVGLFAHGIGIGAFIYLRRVFEKLIADAHVLAATEAEWNEALYEKSRMDARIQLLANRLPRYVVENKAVYHIMSKGVHELDEAECLEYFPVVRVALELMLDEKVEALAREQKVASTRASLDRIISTLKQR